jgi:hypothetical protein
MKRAPMLLLVGVLFISSCGSDSETGPSPTSFTGTWNGTAQDSVAGAGVFTATLAETLSSLTGTWRIAFPQAGFDNGGSLGGTVSGNSAQAELQPSVPKACPFNLTVNITGSTMRGTYASFNCTGTITGSISATRQ